VIASRYELKFVADRHNRDDIISMLRILPIQLYSPHETRRVNNIYFDNNLGQCLNDNVSGKSQRYKVRLRWYGESSDVCINPQLEIKIKDNHTNSKRIIQIPVNIDLRNTTWQDVIKKIQLHLSSDPEIERLFLETTIPSLINWYYRKYFVTYCGKVRVTLDYNQGAINQIYSVSPEVDHTMFQQAPCIIEIKGKEEDFSSIIEYANQLPFKRSRFSKYVYWMHYA